MHIQSSDYEIRNDIQKWLGWTVGIDNIKEIKITVEKDLGDHTESITVTKKLNQA